MILPPGIKKNSVQYNKYLEGTYAILREPNTIPYLYELQLRCELFESSGKQELLEKYAEINLSPTIISDTLLNLIYNYKKNHISKDKLLELLNTEFLKVKICFELDTTPIRSRYPNSGIVRAETYKTIYIYVNKKFIDILDHTDTLHPAEDFNNLVHDLFHIYTHETTHNYQQGQTKKAIPAPNPTNRKEYLSQPLEIDTHARELASRLLRKYNDFSQINDLLTHNSKKLLIDDIWEEYYSNFGAYDLEPKREKGEKERLWRINVFKKFKKRIYDFLLLDKQFLNKSSKIYDILKQL